MTRQAPPRPKTNTSKAKPVARLNSATGNFIKTRSDIGNLTNDILDIQVRQSQRRPSVKRESKAKRPNLDLDGIEEPMQRTDSNLTPISRDLPTTTKNIAGCIYNHDLSQSISP